jgi:outer membrane protein OmpA-like peptidoglycan-associated protein
MVARELRVVWRALVQNPDLYRREKMIAHQKCNLVTLGAAALLAIGSTGCLATRNYVQNQAVAPLKTNIQTVDKKVDTKTNELDQRISDVDRHAEEGYSNATAKAEAADKDAQKADQDAQSAQQTADKGVTLASQDQQEIENIDNYQQVKTGSVLFGFNKAELTDDDQQQLADLTQSLTPLKHYVIEVEGYTDKVGSKQYNLELSRRRADAVVRYLTVTGHVPLLKIHVLGLGEDEPVADNTTKDGRKQNRRVEIRVMAPELGQQAAAGANQQHTASTTQ